METTNPIIASLNEPFVAGIAEDVLPISNRLWKLEGGAIYFCLRGRARIAIDLKEYKIAPNTQSILLPGTIIKINDSSPDFVVSFFDFQKELLLETTARFEPAFFRFLKENPCYNLSEENTETVKILMRAATAIYADRENRFRNQMVKNHFQCFMWDIYDKCYRYFGENRIIGGNRQDKIFMNFIALAHEWCTSEREVSFYADKLCISTNYLTTVCRNVADKPAKQIIDLLVILEIKVLLQSPELSVQEIADRLAFPDQSYLGRYFKRYEGISPKEYRKRITAGDTE